MQSRDLPRLIPAHAGKTHFPVQDSNALRAHPRSRGENYGVAFRHPIVSGSSPLTRGKLRAVLRRLLSDGLIPAHAGKTAHARLENQPHWAHPRSRGENGLVTAVSVATGGSSPLTRGKRGS